MIRTGLVLRALALAFWFGGGLATFLATSKVFATSPDRKLAGDLAGAILERVNAVRSLCVLVFLFAFLLGARGPATAAGGACSFLQVLAIAADAMTRRARRAAGGSIASLPPGDPRRKRFAALHGAAMLLLTLQVLAAALGLALVA